ncbi:hypothetical protein A1O3_05773 [Capronia epimyces CBS 606.96]|uniref:Uncharacterized protein n=1 Tax=Capronia epimyces CBS 606.96 TaxID=1182542 RepID=W9XXY0_9EURO|nr:uncharacterized protein A1O3_05773 [Capronia epimyces CBS 606.96]EXJ85098.1 hypothetical protein A1O3_05773 [Capronia epimyces CBS 606.96]
MGSPSKAPPTRIMTRPSPYRKQVRPKDDSTDSLPLPVAADNGGRMLMPTPHQTRSRSPQKKPMQPQQPSNRAREKARAQTTDYEDGENEVGDIVHVRYPGLSDDTQSPRANSSEAARLTLKEPNIRKTPLKTPSSKLMTPAPKRKISPNKKLSPESYIGGKTRSQVVASQGRGSPEAAAGSSRPPLRVSAPSTTPPAERSFSKRPAPEDDAAGLAASFPKRVRIQEPASLPQPSSFQATSLEGDFRFSNSGQNESSVDSGELLQIEQADELLQDVLAQPRALGLDQISALFVRLQEKSFRFSQRRFDHELTADQKAAWPLHLLSTQYKPLMLMTQFIADGSRYGWHNFFTKREHRVPLIHGIIGEWFKHRIFNHTAFGAPEDIQEQLEAVDREYIQYDAFVRSKKRAEVLESLKFGYGNNDDNHDRPYFPDQHASNTDKASLELADHLMQLIEPLLPPQSGKSHWLGVEMEQDDATSLHFTIFVELVELILTAATLHFCIRLTGLNGTIVRIAPHVAKGSIYDISQDTNNICVNANFCNSTKSRSAGARDALQVKMTCWGRVEAVTPHGPNRLELEGRQQQVRETLGSRAELSWREVEDQVFPVLPYDLQEDDAGRAAAEKEIPVRGTEWSISIAKAAAKEAREHTFGKRRGSADTEDESSFSSSEDEARARPSKPLRGSFVVVYPNVAPANVYCVWTNDTTKHTQTLEEAVNEARRAKGMYYRLEDLGTHTVNLALEYRAYEWAIATGLIGGLTGGILLSAVARRVVSLSHSLPLDSIRTYFVQLVRDIRNGVPLSLSKALGAQYFSTLGNALKQSGARVKTALDFPSLVDRLRLTASPAVPETTILTSTVTGWTTVTVQPTLQNIYEPSPPLLVYSTATLEQ